MEPEKDDGNVEYKLKLTNKTSERIEKLATQMRFRCNEGNGECIYNIGVEDNGVMTGITTEEYEESIHVLNTLAEKNNYIVKLLGKTNVNEDKCIYEVLIRENNETNYINTRVAIAGNVDSGKSSLLGVLTTGKYDNGNGSARLSIFNYQHEVKTGRTSSVGHHILGFDKNGKPVNYSGINGKLSWPEIVSKSSKIVELKDLCGHEKYLKTTILGLSSSQPDLCLIIVSANKGIKNEKSKNPKNINKNMVKNTNNIENMTKEHIFLCITLGIPFAIVITKVDMIAQQSIENVFKETMTDIQQLIKCPGIRRQPLKVETDDDILICAKQIHTESIVPIFCVSNTTGQGIDNIYNFLNILPKNTMKTTDSIEKSIHHLNHVEYHIDSVWSVPGVGTVVGGYLVNGCVSVNDKLLIGPVNNSYEQITVRSIHCKKVPVQTVNHGSYICLGLKKYDRKNIRKGNVIISDVSQQIVANKFTAEIKVIRSHSTTIDYGYQPVIHAFAVRQTAKIIKIEKKINSRNVSEQIDNNSDISSGDTPILRPGDSATVTFEFCYHSEFIKVNTRILCSEGRTKIIGIVKSIN